MLITRCFGAKWISWVKSVMYQGSVGIVLNNTSSSFFTAGKGLRQGDPLSLILFNLVADVFTKMLVKATRKGFVHGYTL